MNDDFLDDRADENLSVIKAHLVELLRDDRRELVDSPEQLVSLGCVLMLLLERLEFFVEFFDSYCDRLSALFEFLLVDEPALKRIEQSASFSADPGSPLLRILELD